MNLRFPLPLHPHMRSVLFAGIIATLIFTNSCSTDFDLTSDWKDITVVYGLVESTPADTATYFRITRAFLNESGNALDYSQVPDSLFYAEEDISVRLESCPASNSIFTPVKSTVLKRVDGNLDGYPRLPGVWANIPNWLYKANYHASKDSTYRVVVTNTKTGKVTEGIAKVVADFPVTVPSSPQKLQFLPQYNSTFSWKTASNGRAYDLVGRFWYEEITLATGDSNMKSVDWYIFSNLAAANSEGGHDMKFSFSNQTFYDNLNNFLTDNPDVVRRARYIDFTFSVGGDELYTYYLVNSAQTGITSGLVQPEYTNLTDNTELGKASYGIFSSRFHKTIPMVSLQPQTIDSLACMSSMQHLSFLDSHGNLCH